MIVGIIHNQLSAASKSEPPSYAPFTGPIKTAQCYGHGLGYVATREIKAGEILLCEEAFALSFEARSPNTPSEVAEARREVSEETHISLLKDMLQKLRNDPLSRDRFFQLRSGVDDGIQKEKSKIIHDSNVDRWAS